MSAAPTSSTVVKRARLTAQGLLVVPGQKPTPGSVVRNLGLVQAQDLRQAFWALGVRAPGSTASQVRAAFDAGTIVSTWAARGTLMLVSPELVDDVLTITAPRMQAQAATGFREAGIGPEVVASLGPAVRERCTGGATRGELLEAIRAAGQDTSGQRGYHLLMALSLARTIVQGPMDDSGGVRQLFVPYREWIGGTGHDDGDRQAVLERLALGYYAGHGPATDADFAWWLGLPLTPVRGALARLEQDGHMASRRLGATTYWMSTETAADLDGGGQPPGAQSVLALPGFDEFLLGYRDRSASLAPEHASRVVPGGNGVFRRTIVRAGAIVGTWDPPGTAEYFGPPPGASGERDFAARMLRFRDFWAR